MAAQQLRRAPGSSGLYDVLELILDRGMVIDAYARVSLVGIELLTVDLRVVVASVDTYIRYAEAMERLGWHDRDRTQSAGLPDMVGDGMTKHAINRGSERMADAVTGSETDAGGAGNGQGMSGALASGARTAAEATGGALARGAEKLKDSVSGEEEEEAARPEQRRGEHEDASVQQENQDPSAQHDHDGGEENK